MPAPVSSLYNLCIKALGQYHDTLNLSCLKNPQSSYWRSKLADFEHQLYHKPPEHLIESGLVKAVAYESKSAHLSCLHGATPQRHELVKNSRVYQLSHKKPYTRNLHRPIALVGFATKQGLTAWLPPLAQFKARDHNKLAKLDFTHTYNRATWDLDNQREENLKYSDYLAEYIKAGHYCKPQFFGLSELNQGLTHEKTQEIYNELVIKTYPREKKELGQEAALDSFGVNMAFMQLQKDPQFAKQAIASSAELAACFPPETLAELKDAASGAQQSPPVEAAQSLHGSDTPGHN